MAKPNKLLAQFVIALVFAALASTTIFADKKEDDKSFSSVVKYMKSNYKAKGQGTFGMVTFARFLVKVIRPAGVKNFKLSMLRDLQFTSKPVDDDLGTFIRSNVHSGWEPLTQVVSRRENQYVYVYFMPENDHAKFLIVAVQKQEAFVIQFKFEPERLAKFLEKPEILGISLTGDDEKKNRSDQQNKPADEENKKPEEGKKNNEAGKSNLN
jgi:hypothetical protein